MMEGKAEMNRQPHLQQQKANQAEPLTGAKPKPKTGRARQPPKKKKKGADGNAIKSEEDDDSGMWSSEEE
jgi:hypothetical protein